MLRRIALATLLVLGSPGMAAAAEIPLFLWEVSHPDQAGRAPDYLAGTIHVSWPKGTALSADTLQALKACNHFVMEADHTKVTSQALAPWLWLPNGQRNSGRLQQGLWTALLDKLRSSGYSADVADRLAPWFLINLLANPAKDPLRTVDTLLRQAAHDCGHSMSFLEEPTDQFRMLAGFPLSYYDRQLADLDGIRAYHDQLTTLYDQGDLAGLQALTIPETSARQHPEVYEAMLFVRNRRWLPQLEQHLQRHDAFIAVGIGHLVGEQGLLHQLAVRGYRIRQIQPSVSSGS